MTSCYIHADRVKAIGNIEIIFQFLLSLSSVILVAVLNFGFGPGVLTTVKSIVHSDNWGNATYVPDPTPKGGFFIALLLILIFIVVFEGWLVTLVLRGAEKRNTVLLTIWYIIHSILLTIGLIIDLMFLFRLLPWYAIILRLVYVSYRIYSILIVSRHAEEIKTHAQRGVFLI